MNANDRAGLDQAVADARSEDATALAAYCDRLATAEALLFVYLVTRAVVALAKHPDAVAVVEAASNPRTTDRGERSAFGRARAAFALVLPTHTSQRDKGLWAHGVEGGAITVSASLASDVRHALRDFFCAAIPTLTRSAIPEQLDNVWTRAKATVPKLSVRVLCDVFRAIEVPARPALPTTAGPQTMPQPPPRNVPSSRKRQKQQPKPVAAPRPPTSPPQARQVAGPDLSTGGLVQSYASTAYVERRGYSDTGYCITQTSATTSFEFDEFLSAQYVLDQLQKSSRWRRLVLDADRDRDPMVTVPLPQNAVSDVDRLLDVIAADSTTHDELSWTEIFNGAHEQQGSGRFTVEFRASDHSEATFDRIRTAILEQAFGVDPAESPLKVLASGGLWAASGTGAQEPHLDFVPIKVVAHLARCGVLPYAVFVTGAEARSVWIGSTLTTISPYTIALVAATQLHQGAANDTEGGVSRLFMFLAEGMWAVEDEPGETSTFRLSDNRLPNNWQIANALAPAHTFRNGARATQAAVRTLALQ